jgi:hypothetical protein
MDLAARHREHHLRAARRRERRGSLAWSAFVGDTCDVFAYAALGTDGTLFVTANLPNDAGAKSAFLYAFAP